MKESLVYKGYKIVEQIRMYEVWDGASSIVEYEPEFDAYLIWDVDNNEQYAEFQEAYDTVDEAMAAIDKFLEVV